MVKKFLFLGLGFVFFYSFCFAQTVSPKKAQPVLSKIQTQIKEVQLIEPEVRIQPSTSMNLSTGRQDYFFSTSDTLKNDDDDPKYFFSGLDYNASRFSPDFSSASACTLKEMMIAFYVPEDTFFITQQCSLFVWDNFKNNTPGNQLLASKFTIPQITPGYYGWIILDLSPFNIISISDFWLGYKKIIDRPPFGLGDGTPCAANRNMWRSKVEDNWKSYTDGDFLIRAIVTYAARREPHIIVQPTLHDFGDVELGKSSDLILTVSNRGKDSTLVMSDINSDKAEFTVNPTFDTVSPGGNTGVTVTFRPVNIGEVSGTITIISNDPESPTFPVYLFGTGKDLNPPVITFDPSFIPIPNLGNSVLISDILITDNSGIDKAYIFYRKGGAASYDSLQLETTDGTNYKGTIAASFITTRGLEYYIKATDTQKNSSTSPVTEPKTNPYTLIVNVLNLTKASVQPANSYRMISIPINLDNGSPDNVLVDDLGSYKKSEWRLFRYQEHNYVELSDGGIENFDSGKAFWLITKEAKTIDSGAGKSVTTSTNFTVTLQPGWNMIANPFDFDVDWNNVIRSNSVEASLWWYDGKSYTNKTRLASWEGYFVKNLEGYNVTIEIPPKEATGGLAKPAFEFLAKGSPSEGEWSIQIEARVGNYCDEENYIGSLINSHNEWDKKDISEPPQPPGDYVSLYFPHQTWEKYPGIYTTDFRPISEDGEIWDFIVDANIPDAEVLLEFKNLSAVPDGFDVLLFDKALQIAKDLKSNNQYAFKVNTSRRFSIIVGTKQFVEKNKGDISLVPDEYALWQNYPNPFNSTTTIKYELPKASKVTLKIYNIMGQEIAILVNEYQDAGYHTVRWDAIEAPTGIYFCQIQAGSFAQIRKMALLR